MRITGNLANHSRAIARIRLGANHSRVSGRPGVVARSKLAANHSRVIARPGVVARSRLAANHSRDSA